MKRKIQPRKLGRTGVSIFPIGLGAMPLSIEGRPDEAQAIRTLHAALDAGANLIDTADVYCTSDEDLGHNERLIAKALRERGLSGEIGAEAPHVVVATKGGLRRPGGDWVSDGSPERLRQACEWSLKSLGTEAIFLYQLHAPGDEVPLLDSVQELARLKKEGKILHIGLSNVTLEQLKEAMAITRIETVQNRCNVNHQIDFSTGMILFCAENDISYLAYSPVGGHFGHRDLSHHRVLMDLARKYDASPYQVALAWLLHRSDNIVPIPGASKPASIEASVATLRFDFASEDLDRLTQ